METNILIATLAWGLSAKYKNGWEIGCLSTDLAKEFGIDGYELKTAIQEGLQEMSEETYDLAGCYYGHCEINDIDCYWMMTDASDEWTSDMPEWWLDMLDEYHKNDDEVASDDESEMAPDEE